MYPAIFPVLAADPVVTALVGTNPTRVYPHGMATQDTPLPYVVHQLVSGIPENYLGNAPDMDSYRVQFDCYADTVSSAHAVAEAVRSALQGVGYVVSFNGTRRDPKTAHYAYSFDMEFLAEP